MEIIGLLIFYFGTKSACYTQSFIFLNNIGSDDIFGVSLFCFVSV